MSSASLCAMDAKLGWNFCPPEILWKVFKYLCYKELLGCMLVSRRWKDIVNDYTEFHDLWKAMVGKEMDNHGVTYRRKSVLGWKNMFINSILWTFCATAKIKHIHTYKLNNIRHIHMYYDRLIILKKSAKLKVAYYNVTNFDLDHVIDRLNGTVDFAENDSMFISLNRRGVLRLYGKTTPSSPLLIKSRGSSVHSVEKTFLYKLEDNICYVADKKFIVWACVWTNNQWDIRLVGRYDGSANDKVVAIHVYNNRVYIVTNLGFMLSECPKTKKFKKRFNFNIPANKCLKKWVVFHKWDVIVSLKTALPIATLSFTADYNHIIFECPGMSCATAHGEVVIVGFKNGSIFICLPKKSKDQSSKANTSICIQDYDKSIKDPRILALEVFEDRLSHHLLVATKNRVTQLQLTYPNKITELYE